MATVAVVQARSSAVETSFNTLATIVIVCCQSKVVEVVERTLGQAAVGWNKEEVTKATLEAVGCSDGTAKAG